MLIIAFVSFILFKIRHEKVNDLDNSNSNGTLIRGFAGFADFLH